MYKKMCFALLVIALATLLSPVVAEEEAVDASGQWRYILKDGFVAITGYEEEPQGVLMIPGEVDGYPVACVGDDAFAACMEVTGVRLPTGITSIGDRAFMWCEVSAVNLPDGVTSIGEAAFSECSSLTRVTVPESVLYIGEYTFDGCPELIFAVVPGSYAERYAKEHWIPYIDNSGSESFPLAEDFPALESIANASVLRILDTLRDDPEDTAQYFNLWEELELCGYSEEALPAYVKWLETQPEMTALLDAIRRAEAVYAEGNWEAAAIAYAGMADEEILPTAIVSHYVHALLQMSRFDEAMDLMYSDMGGITAWYAADALQGDICFAAGDLKFAAYYYQKLLNEADYASPYPGYAAQQLQLLADSVPPGFEAAFENAKWEGYERVAVGLFDENADGSEVFAVMRKGDHNVLCLLRRSRDKDGYAVVWENDAAVLQGDATLEMWMDWHDSGLFHYEYFAKEPREGEPSSVSYLFVDNEETSEWEFAYMSLNYREMEDEYADTDSLRLEMEEGRLSLQWRHHDYDGSYLGGGERYGDMPYDASAYALRNFDIAQCEADFEALRQQMDGEPGGEAAPNESGQWAYVLGDDGAIIVGAVAGLRGDLLIPGEIDGVPVTGIGNVSFADGYYTSVIIPESVTSIGEEAFAGSGLTQVILPDTLTYLGDGAFAESDLVEIVLPDSLDTIGEMTFWRCESLEQATLPSTLLFIGEGAFWDCNALTWIVLPSSVSYIGDGAFEVCSGDLTMRAPLDSYAASYAEENEIPFVATADTETAILPETHEYQSFSYLINVDGETITIRGYKEIDATWVDIPSEIEGMRVTGIGVAAFAHCRALTWVGFPDTLTAIGDYAFYRCGALAEIILPDALASIGDRAFYVCNALTEVAIPDAVTHIGRYAFSRDRVDVDREEMILSASAGSYAERYARQNHLPFVGTGENR